MNLVDFKIQLWTHEVVNFNRDEFSDKQEGGTES